MKPWILILLLAGCAPMQTTTPAAPSTVDGVRFAATNEAGKVLLMLDNGTRQPIGYNLCSSQLQKRDGTGWSDVATDDVCTMELRTLNPGFDATFEKRLPASLAAGEYRYVTRIESPVGTPPGPIASNGFRTAD
jgi:hypothetical protein